MITTKEASDIKRCPIIEALLQLLAMQLLIASQLQLAIQLFQMLNQLLSLTSLYIHLAIATMAIQQKTFIQKILSSQTSSKNMCTAQVVQKANLQPIATRCIVSYNVVYLMSQGCKAIASQLPHVFQNLPYVVKLPHIIVKLYLIL